MLWGRSRDELHHRIYSQQPIRDWEGQLPHMYGEIVHSSLVSLYDSYTQVRWEESAGGRGDGSGSGTGCSEVTLLLVMWLFVLMHMFFIFFVPAGQKRALPGAVLLPPAYSGPGSFPAGLHLQGITLKRQQHFNCLQPLHSHLGKKGRTYKCEWMEYSI